MSELITSDDAANILGVTPMRIRQLNTKGRITGIPYGSRTVLYDRGEIEAYALATRGHAVTSGVALTATPASFPLPLVEDTIVEPRSVDHVAFHLRIYRGADRTVVVTGPVAGRVPPPRSAYEEYVVGPVSDRYFSGDPLSAYWIDADFGGRGVLNHVVFEDDGSETAWPLWRRIRTIGRSRRPLRIAVAPVADGIRVLDRLVGQAVRHFPDRQSATREHIAALARTGDPVSVVYDQLGIRTIAEAMMLLHGYRATDPPTTDVALRAMWDQLDMMFERLDDDTDTRYLVEPQWLRDRDGKPGPLDPEHCAVTAVIDTFDDLHWHELAGPPVPDRDELRRCWIGLCAWVDTIGPYGPPESRNPRLAAAVNTAREVVEQGYQLFRRGEPDPAPLPPYPDTEIEHFHSTAVLDEFWQRSTDGVEETSAVRRLRERLAAVTDDGGHRRQDVRTGPNGLPIGRYATTPFGEATTQYLLAWPWTPQSVPRLADETRIVSAAAEFGGFAVFLRLPGGALTPLPRPNDYYTDSPWDYGNQGSHSLTHAIARLLEVSDGIELTGADVSPEYLVIEAAVRDSSTDYLDLSVGHLRAQIAAAAST